MGNSSSKWIDDDIDYATYSHTVLSVPDTMKQFQRVPHMKTGSLALVHQRGSSSWFCTCTIDAPVACRVGLYLLAREEVGGRIHSTYSPAPVISLNYDAGMSQNFPSKFAREIHLGSPHTYIKASNGRYPIALRIESLAPAYASRYTLDSLPPIGSDVTQFMCVHTVFAHLKLSAGAWDVEVVKEHLWLAGNPFLLPTPAKITAVQMLLQRPRLAATPAQLRERRLREEQAQQLLKVQQANRLKKEQAIAKQQAERDAALADQYPPVAQYPLVPQYPPVSFAQQAQLLPQSMPLQLPASQPLLPAQLAPVPQYAAGTQGLPALAPAAPLQSPFAASQGMVALPPAAPLQSPFVAGLPQQNAVRQLSDYPLVAHLA